MIQSKEKLFETYLNLRTALIAGLATLCVGAVALAVAALFRPLGDDVNAAVETALGSLESAGLWVLFGILTVLSLTVMPICLALYFGFRMRDVTHILKHWQPKG